MDISSIHLYLVNQEQYSTTSDCQRITYQFYSKPLVKTLNNVTLRDN